MLVDGFINQKIMNSEFDNNLSPESITRRAFKNDNNKANFPSTKLVY